MDDHDGDDLDDQEIPPELMAQFQALMAQQQALQAQQAKADEDVDFDKKAQEEFFDACKAGNLAVVKEKFAYGGIMLELGDKRSKREKNGLLLAVAQGHLAVIKFLIEEAKSNPDAKAKGTMLNSLHYAAEKGHLEVVKYLVEEKKFDIEALGVNDLRPLHMSVLHSHTPVCQYLVERGAEVDSRTRFGSTALYMACGNKDDTTIQFLLSKGANANVPNRDGVTPLHVLVRHGYLNAVKILVETGHADITLADNSGKTALDDADMHGMTEVAIYLWSKGAEPSAKNDDRTSLRCVRPLSLNTPSPRANAAIASDGKAKVFIWGGYGVPKDYVLHDPMNELPRDVKVDLNHDLAILDLDETKLSPIVEVDRPQPYRNLKLGRTPEFKAPHIALLADGLTANADYPPGINPQSFQLDQIIKAEAPFTKENGFAYFEVHILDPGTSRITTVGLTNEGYPGKGNQLDKQPGWLADSYASHSDDGCIFHNRGRGVPFVERTNPGDVIGCGISWERNLVFFTKNGLFLGAPFKAPQSDKYWATIGVANPEASFKVNFGASPFKFNMHVPTTTWTYPEVTGDIPAPHARPQMFYIPENKVLALFTDKLYIYQIAEKNWKIMPMTNERPGNIQWYSLVRLAKKDTLFYLYGLARVPLQGKIVMIPVLLQHDLAKGEVTELIPPRDAESMEKARYLAAGNLFEAMRKGQVERMTVTKDDQFCFFTMDNKMLFVDPESLEIREENLKGALFNSQRSSLVSLTPDTCFTFGGFYKAKDSVGNEGFIVEPATGTVSKPHIDGAAVPLPRDGASAAVVNITNSALTDLSPEEEKLKGASKAIITVFGTGSSNFVDDFDLLFINSGNKGDELQQLQNNEFLSDVEIKLRDGRKIAAHSVVLYCRSEYFRALFDASTTPVTSIEVTDVDANLFEILLGYFYSDGVEKAAIGPNFRIFASVVEKYGKEHLSRILEDYLITKAIIPSAMGDSMKRALNLERFSDVVFVFANGTKVPAHKAVICSRSTYFAAMLTGNLKEAKQREIVLSEDTRHEAFMHVLNFVYTKDLEAATQALFAASESDGTLIVDVFALACQYNIRKLKNELEWSMASNIQPENVSTLLVLADQHSALILKSHSLAFLRANMEEVAKTEDYLELKDSVEGILAQPASGAAAAATAQ